MTPNATPPGRMTRRLGIALLTLCLSLAAALAQNAPAGQKADQMLRQALFWIDNMYVDSVNTTELAEEAIRAMVKQLDPHSAYMTADEVAAMNENLGGNFEGIGIRYQMENDTLLVISTVGGGPSEKAGIMATDRIITVDDTLIAGRGMQTREIQRRLRGPKGSHVRLGVMRQGVAGLMDFDVVRDKIPVNSVDAAYMVTPTIGYVKVLRFATGTADEVQKAMGRLRDQGMTDLIVDMQGNGGGYLNAAVELASIFLPSGRLVVYTKGRRQQQQDYHTAHGGWFKGRVAVLIDEQSASAAEIFTGAMQDYDRAVVIGRRSFGKGLVQRPISLAGGSMIKLTVSHYYTPSGRCIQKPYTKGDKAAYDHDIADRLSAGELYSADSIHFADSLRYVTVGGRTVYGGGGIMPDLFVPIDTTRMTPAHRSLVAKGTLHRYVLDYFKAHQHELHEAYPTVEAFAEGFTMPDEAIDQLVRRAQADSLTLDPAELEASRPVLLLQLKANVASDLYEASAYTRIINELNPAYTKAVEVLQTDLYTKTIGDRNGRLTDPNAKNIDHRK